MTQLKQGRKRCEPPLLPATLLVERTQQCQQVAVFARFSGKVGGKRTKEFRRLRK